MLCLVVSVCHLRGVLNYQLVVNLLLRKVSNQHMLETRPPKDTCKLFTQVCSIKESGKSFKSQAYLTCHGTRIKNSLTLKTSKCENSNQCQ